VAPDCHLGRGVCCGLLLPLEGWPATPSTAVCQCRAWHAAGLRIPRLAGMLHRDKRCLVRKGPGDEHPGGARLGTGSLLKRLQTPRQWDQLNLTGPADPVPCGVTAPLPTRLPSADHRVLPRGLMSPAGRATELGLRTSTSLGIPHATLRSSA